MSEQWDSEYKQAGKTPFWHKLPFFFLFPLRPGPLVLIASGALASALAAMVLGRFDVVFRLTLVYLGLRYGFKLLVLFSQGRFDGLSLKQTVLGGAAGRPAKLALLLASILAICVALGNSQLAPAIAANPGVQEQLMGAYKKDAAAALALREAEMAAFNLRVGRDPNTSELASAAESTPDQHAALIATGPDRADILAMYRPDPSSALWYKLQPGWFWLAVLALSLILPSAFAVIGRDDRFFKALNPLHARSLGSAYPAVWALLLLTAAVHPLAVFAGPHLPAALRFPLELALAGYFALVLFAMLGYALWQNQPARDVRVVPARVPHRAMGLPTASVTAVPLASAIAVPVDSANAGALAIPKGSPVLAAVPAVEPAAPLERKVQALLADGDVGAAIAAIEDVLRSDPYHAQLNTRLHQLLAAAGDTGATLTHGQQWLSAMARAGDDRGTLIAALAMYTLDEDYVITDGDAILPAARAAMLAREPIVAMKLVRSFDKRYPNHKDTAAVYFIAARLASEHFRQNDTAVRILRTLVARFPTDPVSAEAGAYLLALDATIAQLAAA